MIRRARAASTQYDNMLFVVGSAQQIPWQENFFDKVLSVESFYYYGDQGGALEEVLRVMAPGGELNILINLYRDNPLLAALGRRVEGAGAGEVEQEYIEMLKAHGFEERPCRADSGLDADAGGIQRQVVQECGRAERLQAHWGAVAGGKQARVKRFPHGDTEGTEILR